jgi:CubicO group peptidase (beta-lactamase class C family)
MDTGRISDLLAKLAQAHWVPGAQLALHRAGETTTFEAGHAEHGGGPALTRDAKVPIGSVTKAFTADAAMALVADGDLDLDEPVSRTVAELRAAPGALGDRLTLRHLLSHTGGLPSDGADDSASSIRRYVLDCVRHLRHQPTPGIDFSYSNVGYALAGLLIEQVTGMTWWESVDAVVARPLGIGAAFVVTPDGGEPAQPHVAGHVVNRVQGSVRPVGQTVPPALAPAGGLAASALDLLTLGRAYLARDDAGPIEPKLRTEMLRAAPGTDAFGLAHGWGLGLALFRAETADWWGHDGMGDGTSCHLRIEPSEGTVLALTTNASTGFAMWKELVTELRSVGIGIGDYEIPTTGGQRIAPPPDCAGHYLNGDTTYVVSVDGDTGVQVSVDGQPVGELTLYADLVFAMRDVIAGERTYAGRFLRNPNSGRIDGIQVTGRVARRLPDAQQLT